MSRWTSEVRLERARLAIVDPLGERDAVAPLSWFEAVAIIRRASAHLRDHQSRPARARRDDHQLIDTLGIEPGRRGGIIRCPAHEDDSPSLSWRIEADKLLLHCFAGCTWPEILEAVGMVTA